jgi:hypothetical protein
VVAGWERVKEDGLSGVFGNTRLQPVYRPCGGVEQAIESLVARAAAPTTDAEQRLQLLAAVKELTGQSWWRPPSPAEPAEHTSGHRGRMDAARVVITAVLTIGVLLVVLLALARGDSGAAAQYAAPVSGLAGICLGWLFTNQPPTSRADRPPTGTDDDA